MTHSSRCPGYWVSQACLRKSVCQTDCLGKKWEQARASVSVFPVKAFEMDWLQVIFSPLETVSETGFVDLLD